MKWGCGFAIAAALSAGCQLGSQSPSGGAYELATSSSTSGDDGASTGEDTFADESGDGTGGADDAAMTTGPFDPTDGDSGSDTGVENDCPRVQVMTSGSNNLNVRPSPSTAGDPIGSLPNGAIVDVLGEEIGEPVSGDPLWYHIQSGMLDGYVSAVYASCTLEMPPEISEDGWYLPLECGMSAVVSQRNFGGTTHQGTSA